MRRRHHIQFPRADMQAQGQDQTWFHLLEDGVPRRIRFHDYDAIYRVPGLYEQLFYDRLKCQSPAKVAQILAAAVHQADAHLSELRVLDLGAGNGMMGEALAERGVSRLVGLDIIEEARDATLRDRPGLYDGYYVEDVCALAPEKREEILSWHCDCMTSVAALGFGDIPTAAFVEAFNLVSERAWIAFNIKETFLDESDRSGFSTFIRSLIFSPYLKVYHLERYRHRLSIDGEPLFYFALAGHKQGNIPPGFADALSA
jgi:hypothetical protein